MVPSGKRREDCICACFREGIHEPQVLPFGEKVMYMYTAVPTGNLDQRWGHGIWVGKAPMTDEHIILTECGVQKARSLHRVPPEEIFSICELKKVRGLPWNGDLESNDCDETGPRPIWTSTCVFDDQCRGNVWSNALLQWLCRLWTAHRRMSCAIVKGIG